jgi:hypothetical protein
MLFALPIYAVGASWTPTQESLNIFYVAPNYNDSGLGTWTPTVGTTNLVGTAEPNPVAVGGAPDCEASTDFPLGAAIDANTVWMPDPAHTLFCSIVLESVTRNSATPYLNDGIISDNGQYCGIFLRNNVGTITLYHYQWDTAVRVASVDVTSLLSSGSGLLIAQAKKEGGILYIRAANATTTTGWVSGDACGNLNSSAFHLRIGGATWTPDGIVKAVGVASTAWSNETAEKFETWARRL